jgi:hypothetical protein
VSTANNEKRQLRGRSPKIILKAEPVATVTVFVTVGFFFYCGSTVERKWGKSSDEKPSPGSEVGRTVVSGQWLVPRKGEKSSDK